MNKNIIIISTLTFIVGFLTHAFVFSHYNMLSKDMHEMPTGKMIHNGDSNMQAMMHDMNASLRGKSGAELEKAFLTEMIVHHEGAVEMGEVLLKGTQRPELVKLANGIISAQNTEIEMMKKWKTEWFTN